MADQQQPAPEAGMTDDVLTPGEQQLVGQAQNPDAVRNALITERQRARDAQKRADELAARVQEFEDKDRTDLERLQKALEKTAAERDEHARTVSELQAARMRAQVAAELGLPAALVDRLRGDDEQTVRRDAQQLLEALPAPTTAVNGFPQGPRGAARTLDLNDFIRSHAAG